MNKILFPTDFSEHALNAFKYAINLATKINADIITLHVYEKPNIPGIEKIPFTAQEVYESIKMETFEEYRKEIAKYRELAETMKASNLNINHELKEGVTIPTIVKMAKEENVDFLVMGTKGARGLKEIFLGSFTGEIMEKAPCPVIGVPIDAKLDNIIDKIGLTYDFEKDTPGLLAAVRNIADIFNAEIHCLHVDSAHTASLSDKEEEMKAFFKGDDRFIPVIIESSDLLNSLSEYAEKHELDIMTMITHKRNFFQELFYYSLAKRMAYHTTIPILALPASILIKEEA